MAALSGIKLDPSVLPLYEEIKLRKCNKYIAFKLSDDRKKVIIDDEIIEGKVKTDSVEEDEEYFNKMKSHLTKDEPRYLLYDFGFRSPEGREIRKLSFIYWCSIDCNVKKRMIYASTKDTIKKVFTGTIGLQFEIDDFQEFDYTELMTEVKKKA